MASPVAPDIHPEEQDAELEASLPPEVRLPLAASPAAAVQPEPAWAAPADITGAPPPLDEEPSLEPALAPASEEQGPLIKCTHPVP